MSIVAHKFALTSLKFVISFLFCIFPLSFGDIAVLNSENRSVELIPDYKITYTPSIPDEGIFGYLTLAFPPDACSPIRPPPKDIASVNWFVLAYRSEPLRSGCSNPQKIQHAANAGYKAIILYQEPFGFHKASISYLPLEHSNLSIPAVLVSQEDGTMLRENYLYKNGYKIFITLSIPMDVWYYLTPFAVVIAVGALLIISYLVFQLMMCIMERRKAQRHRLPKKFLKRLTLQKYEKGIYYDICAICLEHYIEGEKIRILPCNHAYHQKCIDPWLTKIRRDCPVCKAKVTLPGMEEFSDSDSENEHRLTSNETASETTNLLPSTNASTRETSRDGRFNRYRSDFIRELRNLYIDEGELPQRNDSSNRANTSGVQQAYDYLDDTIHQPGPSNVATSASIAQDPSPSKRNKRRKRDRERERRHQIRSNTVLPRSTSSSRLSNVLVVVDVSQPLVAPPQLSINCADSESERPITPNPSVNNVNVQASHQNDRSLDQIV